MAAVVAMEVLLRRAPRSAAAIAPFAPRALGAAAAAARLTPPPRALLAVALVPGRRGFAAAAGGASPMRRGLVSCEWLREELSRSAPDEAPRLVDATWYLPNSPYAAPPGTPPGGAGAVHAAGPRLPGSAFFDLDKVATEHPEGLPVMLPDEATFSAAMNSMGIGRSTRVVVYDRHGLFSAPRFWYTLKVAFGHPGEVAVLDGGLPRWQELGYPVEEGPMQSSPQGQEPAGAEWRLDKSKVWSIEQMRANVKSKEALVLDSRPAERFEGSTPEPRAGYKGGHIPGSFNLPFGQLAVKSGDGARRLVSEGDFGDLLLKRTGTSAAELLAAEGGPLVVTTCGSAMTACILGLALHQAGLPLERWAVYDGAWSEWGREAAGTPIDVGPATPRKPPSSRL